MTKRPEDNPSSIVDLARSISIQISGSSKHRQFQRMYANDRIAFVHDILPKISKTFAPYQEEILGLFDDGYNRVAVRGPHGLGKTALAAILDHHAVLTSEEDAKVPTTASAWRQLEKYLWPEIRKISKMINWSEVGRDPYNERTEFLTLSLRLHGGLIESFAVASDDHNTIEGAHATFLLYIFDEAKTIPRPTWNAAEGAFSTANAVIMGESINLIQSDDQRERVDNVLRFIKDNQSNPISAEAFEETDLSMLDEIPDKLLVNETGIIAYSPAKRSTEVYGDPNRLSGRGVLLSEDPYRSDKEAMGVPWSVVEESAEGSVSDSVERSVEGNVGGIEGNGGSIAPPLPPLTSHNSSPHDSPQDRPHIYSESAMDSSAMSARSAKQNISSVKTPRTEDASVMSVHSVSAEHASVKQSHAKSDSKPMHGVHTLSQRDRASHDKDIVDQKVSLDPRASMGSPSQSVHVQQTISRALAFAISTPGDPSGQFYDIHVHRPGYEDWCTRHVTIDEAIAAGRVSAAWVLQREKQWGKYSSLFLNRCLGEFADDSEEGIIPLSWVMLAIERWYVWKRQGFPAQDGIRAIGVDVASSGEDKTVLACRDGSGIQTLLQFSKAPNTTVAGHVKLHSAGHEIHIETDGGYGAGVFDILKDDGVKRLFPIKVSAPTGWRDRSGELRFLNVRAAMWWNMREMLDPANGVDIMLPNVEELKADLVTPKWEPAKNGTIKVQSKEEISRVLGRSPDFGDATCLAFWTPSSGGGIVF